MDKLHSSELGTFLRKERTKRNISIVDLSNGLVSASMLQKIETGERPIEKRICQRMLERLGATNFFYENYVPKQEYEAWKLREWILNALDVEDTSTAWELLQQYEEIYGAENKVEKQFCLIMRVQCMQQEKKPTEEWLPILEQALYETIPNALHKPLDSLILAAEELNLIVEYVYYQEELSSVELYEELFSYASRMDIWSQAKLCPKIALFFSKWVNAQEENLPLEEVATLAERANRMCNDSIEALRIHAKIYFLLEVFEEKKNLISLLMKQKLDAETKKRKNFKNLVCHRNCIIVRYVPIRKK